MLMRCTKCQISFDEGELTPSRECMTCFRPEAKRVREASERLRSYVSESGDNGTKLDFSTGLIWQGEQVNPRAWPARCQTIACFAGHYFMACLAEEPEEAHPWRFEGEQGRGSQTLLLLDTKTKVHAEYHQGTRMLARDLGFNDQYQLMRWARRHPALWGCYGGEYMFGSRVAFTALRRPQLEELEELPPLTVVEIADWLQRVSVRLGVEADNPKGFRQDPALAVSLAFPALTDGELEFYAHP